MSQAPEFSRPIDVRQASGRELHLEANEAERAALAARFGLVRLEHLEARVLLQRQGSEVSATGSLQAKWVQSCAISAEDLPLAIDEPLSMRFVPARKNESPDDEIEIDADDCDEIEYAGTHFDLGEAVAQSLALAIDPYAVGPQAEDARDGLSKPEDNGPFAALKGFTPGS